MIIKYNYVENKNILILKTTLLPKKQNNSNRINAYISSLEEFLSSYHFDFRYKECTIYFICHYSRPDTRYVDNDNLSIKLITDILQRYLLVSDNSSLISTVCISERSSDSEEFSYIIFIPKRLSEEDIISQIEELS